MKQKGTLVITNATANVTFSIEALLAGTAQMLTSGGELFTDSDGNLFRVQDSE